jgi:hypothetical protein
MTHRVLRSTSAVLLLSATLAATPACAASRSRVYVRVGPPAPVVETRVIAPGPGYVWSRDITAGAAQPMCGCPAAGTVHLARALSGCQDDGFTRDVAAGISSTAIGGRQIW